MSRLQGLLYALRSLLRRDAADRETEEEIAFHIDRQTRKHVERGAPPDEARRRALAEFGGRTGHREAARAARGSGALDGVEQDLRQAVRSLRRDPAFLTMGVITLGLAIAANTAMFGIIDRLLLRGPEHVVAPGQLRRIYVTTTNQAGGVRTSPVQGYAFYQLVRGDTHVFAGVGAYTPTQTRIGNGPDSYLVPVAYATADFFPALGVQPLLGRFFNAEEDRPPRGQDVAVLGYGFWQRQFGGDSAVIGKSVRLAGRPFQIIGVAPKGFTGVERAPIEAWMPMSSRAPSVGGDWSTSWRASWLRVVGRLATPEVNAGSRLTTAFRNGYTGTDAEMKAAQVTVRPISFNDQGVEPKELGVSRLLTGVALIMLLLAAANIANLILARALRRMRETGVRLALGAGRWRLVRLTVVEALVMGALAGAAGITLARWGGAAIRTTLLPDVAWSELPVNGHVMVWMIALTIVTAVLVGLVPALRISRLDVVHALRSGGTRAGQGHQGVRTALQVVQLALCVVLLFVAGLFTRSLWNVRQLDLGLEPDRVLAVSVAFPSEGPDWPTRDTRRYRGLQENVRSVPGVAGVALSVGVPLESAFGVDLRIPGMDSIPQAKGGGPFIYAVSPEYFSVVGTRILRGRGFEERDVTANDAVAVINETMAATIWPGADPIGRCMYIGDEPTTRCSRIVGIAADANQWRLKEDAAMQYYIPLGQEKGIYGTTLLVRPSGAATAFISSLSRQLKALVPDARFINVATLQDRLDPEIRPWRVGAMLFGAFGIVAMIVAAIGLFSVVSYLVAQRTHELGVRLALGARRRQVLGLVLRRALGVSLLGSAIGGAIALAGAPVLQPMLFDNPARDPWLLLALTAGLSVAAVLASLLPCWHASRINPMVALNTG